MIYVECHTNLDKGCREDWPTVMAARPMLDDCVQSKSGMRLRVVGITHKMTMFAGDGSDTRPVLRVELSLPKGMSVAQWEG